MPDTEYITAYKVFIENTKGELLPITYLGRYLVKGGYSRNEWNEAPFGGVFALTTEESAIDVGKQYQIYEPHRKLDLGKEGFPGGYHRDSRVRPDTRRHRDNSVSERRRQKVLGRTYWGRS